MIKSRAVIHSFTYIEQTPPHTQRLGKGSLGWNCHLPFLCALRWGLHEVGTSPQCRPWGSSLWGSEWCRLLHKGCVVCLETSGLFLSPLFMVMLFPAVRTVNPVSASDPLCHWGQQRSKSLPSQPQLALLDHPQSIWGG